MAAKIFEHPFDLCKVRLQSQVLDEKPRFNGPIDCLYKTWKYEGIRGLYRVCCLFYSCFTLFSPLRTFRAFLLLLWALQLRTRHYSSHTIIYVALLPRRLVLPIKTYPKCHYHILSSLPEEQARSLALSCGSILLLYKPSVAYHHCI